ncbi:DUF1223 domain-containing protein [Halocynthiibacter sp.]|uniref:DUF1223 domain-containing protein n=1 Tax=Halocynthiibacter sp. TaxID=1979210 RepID=UPI003C402BB6
MIRQILGSAAVAVFSLAAPVLAQNSSNPVVIELYTSQGCSSCPPADALLSEYAQRDDVITLALHVDYWDYIGWADTFARPEHTQRQRGYAAAAHTRTIYTPQMILNGETHIVGNQPADLELALLDQQNKADQLDLTVERGDGVISGVVRNLGYQPSDEGLVVQLVRFIPEQAVEIRRGENAGKAITYTSVVTQMDVLGTWDGKDDLQINAQVSDEDAVVVLVQEANHGSVLAAARLR